MNARDFVDRLRKWRVALAAGCVLASCGVAAQSSDVSIEPRDEAVFACVTSVRSDVQKPTFPANQVRDTSAVVRVRLTFSSPDAPPAAEIDFNNGPQAFADAVSEFVASYRLPCLPAARKVTGTQEFQFVVKHERPAVLGGPARASEEPSEWPPECTAQIRGIPLPMFPFGNAAQGTVLLQARFTGSDAEPELKILYDAGEPSFARAVMTHARAYRLGCLTPGDPPITVTRVFRFVNQEPAANARDPEVTLRQLLGIVKNVASQKVRFDFTTMDCPFKLRVTVYQPYMRNGAEEIGSHSANRREFAEWLRNVTFELPPGYMKTAIGQPLTVKVPCVVLDLT